MPFARYNVAVCGAVHRWFANILSQHRPSYHQSSIMYGTVNGATVLSNIYNKQIRAHKQFQFRAVLK